MFLLNSHSTPLSVHISYEQQSHLLALYLNKQLQFKCSNVTFNPDSFALLFRYSAAANKMMHNCECCQEITTSQKEVELACADGSTVKHVYTVVEACRCTAAECVMQPTPKTQRRRRR